MSEQVPEQLAVQITDRLLDHLAALVRPWLVRVLCQVLDGESASDTDEIERSAEAWTARYRARQRRPTQAHRPDKGSGR